MLRIIRTCLIVSCSFLLCACSGKAGGARETAEADIDLTQLSKTMVYSELYNMLMNPRDYTGKSVKLKGAYYASFSEESNMYCHNVLVSDVSACCEAGIRFIWDNDEHEYPDEYPVNMSEVEVTGTFKIHNQGGHDQGYLEAKELKLIGG